LGLYEPTEKLIFVYPLNRKTKTMDKRTFLKTTSFIGLGSMINFSAIAELVKPVAHIPVGELAKDEDFWKAVRQGYRLKPDYINLENGYYCIQPQEVLEKYIEHVREINLQGAYYMRTVQGDNKKAVVAKLAEVAGCTSEEVVITRNATEALDLVISGQNWQAGDETIMAEHDYGSMQDMFKQVGKRYGVVNKIVSVPLHPRNDEEIIELYANAITPKTKLMMVSHLINITGHVLPVRKICDMAHSKGVPVLVDGAHAFAHLNFKIPDLNCDYYGVSLHKWLSTPLGAGLLYVKKENIAKVWPIFGEGGNKETDILHLNHTGTTPVATDLTISDAIDYFNKLGAARKEARLRYLQKYWTDQVRNLPHVTINTPVEPERCCAIANIGIKGLKPSELADVLLKKYKIYTVAIDTPGVQGCRVTPNVFTSTEDMDALVKAIESMG